jgi:hypothetical protein
MNKSSTGSLDNKATDKGKEDSSSQSPLFNLLLKVNHKDSFTEEQIRECVRFFPNWKSFVRQKKLSAVVSQIRKDKIVDKYFPGELRTKKGYDLVGLRYLCQRYESVKSLQNDFHSVAFYLYQKKLMDIIFPHRINEKKHEEEEKTTITEALRAAKTYEALSQFRIEDPHHYGILQKRKLLKDAFPESKKYIQASSIERYSIENLRALVRKSPTLSDFKSKHRREADYISYHELEDEVYPPSFEKETRIKSKEILRNLIILSAQNNASNKKSFRGNLPKELDENFIAYLVTKKIEISNLLGAPLTKLLAVINRVRTSKKITVDPELLDRYLRELRISEESLKLSKGVTDDLNKFRSPKMTQNSTSLGKVS